MKPRYAFLLIALAACAGHRPDPREGLKGGLTDAGQAISGLKISATVPSPKDYLSAGPIDFSRINSDLTFTGQYAIQGNDSHMDCSVGPIRDTVSRERVRGIRIFDISNIRQPKLMATVQTCRGSHTHTVVEDPKDRENVYIYVSGSAGLRSPTELAGCTTVDPSIDPTSALWRIEIIRVPIANP